MNKELLDAYIKNNLSGKGLSGLYFPETICLTITDSTNVRVAEACRNRDSSYPLLITADCQTAGKGRLNRNFYSPDKTGVYFSLFVGGNFDFSDIIKFTPLAAVCVSKAIEKFSDAKPMIKWVNDVYVDDKKVCGILCESVLDGARNAPRGIIIGIGVNLTTKDFPNEISNAASVFGNNNPNEKDFSKELFVSEIISQILEEAPYIAQNRHISYYKSHSYLTGKNIEWIKQNERNSGKCLGIGDNGELIAETDDGEVIELIGGEVTVRTK